MHREPKGRYLIGDGVTRSLGVELTTKIMNQVLRAVFEFDDVRRAPGLAGHLERLDVTAENTLRYEYLGADYLPTAWPNTMVIQVSILLRLVSPFADFVHWGIIVCCHSASQRCLGTNCAAYVPRYYSCKSRITSSKYN